MKLTMRLAVLLALSFLPAVAAQDAVRGGELIVERPTLISLGFEWRVEGDQNGNATARVQYRKAGEAEWQQYLPLYRIGLGLKVHLTLGCGWPQYVIPDAVCGSIMDLEPGTEYEVRLELQDPDGVEGEAARNLTLKTRPEPQAPADAPVRHVYPPDWDGPKEEPDYRNIMEAVNGFGPWCDVYLTVRPPLAATPGTVIKMHGGVHRYDRHLYWKNGRPNPTYWQHGTITLVAKGTPEKPIYIVPAGDGEVVIDGDGAATLFNLRSADYLHFEGLTIRNTDIAFHCGWQGLRGGGMKGLTVKDCLIENVVYGILAQDGRSEDFNILDNIILGRGPQDELRGWPRSEVGYAVNLAGQGHAVGYNYAAGFWDGINVFTGSHSDPQWGQQSRAIDFYNNEISNCGDQFIEADGGYGNIRLLRNRLVNCPSQSVSVQNMPAGPVYWIRNIIWNANRGRGAMKTYGAAQVYLWLHNTASGHMSMPYRSAYDPGISTWIVQNNLQVGPPNEKFLLGQYCAGDAGPTHVVNHNAYNTAARDLPCQLGGKKFASLEALREATGFETDTIFVDGYTVFRDAPEPPHTAGGEPLVSGAEVDVRPKPNAPVVDAGAVIPGINADYTGKAPDIGALEVDRPVPTYGPRTGPYLERLHELQRPHKEEETE